MAKSDDYKRACCTVNPARFSTQSFFDSQLRDSSFCMFYKLPFARIYLRRIGKYFYFVSSIAWDPPPWWGKKKKSAGAQSSIFFPRAFPRDFYSFVVSRHVVGASPMMKVGFHSQLRQVRKSGRDWPLEKLWGEGKFSSRRNFFRYQIPCMNFF